MALKPVDSLVYLYYECSACGTKGDEVRLEEAKHPDTKHLCLACGHVDKIEQVEQIKASFVKVRPWVREEIKRSKSRGMDVTDEQIEEVHRLLVNTGYTKIEAKKAIRLARMGHRPTTVRGLFKLAVKEFDKATA